MKIQLIILLLTLTTLTTVGQKRILTADSDTIYWPKYVDPLYNKIGLEPTEKIQSVFYFRFWDGQKFIELKKVSSKLTGTVIFVIQQYRKKKEGRLFFKKSTLSDKTTNIIFDLLTKYDILNLPTDKKIRGWDIGLDGDNFTIEHADSTSFSVKNYWTPSYYKDKLVEAKQISDFVDSIDNIDELKTLEKNFMTRQPFSSWWGSIGGSTIVSKVY